MNPLSRHLEEYLELRHRLGFKLHAAGCELRKFVRFARRRRPPSSRPSWHWRGHPTTGCQPAHWTTRLGRVRHFASTSVPWTRAPKSLRKACCPTVTIAKAPTSTATGGGPVNPSRPKIPSPKGLRAATYSTLFGLLAVTGLRLVRLLFGPARC